MADEVAKLTFDVTQELLIYIDIFRLYVQFQDAVPPERIWGRSLSPITSVGTDARLIQGALLVLKWGRSARKPMGRIDAEASTAT
jgi:hypothetical protein